MFGGINTVAWSSVRDVTLRIPVSLGEFQKASVEICQNGNFFASVLFLYVGVLYGENH